MALRPSRIVECLWKDVGLVARRIPGPFPRRKVLTWLLIVYLSQSIWLMPLRLLQGERWRAFPGQVVGIARCGDGVLVASETRAWAFDRELRTVRFSINLARLFPGIRVRSLSAADYWEDGLLYLLLGVGESEHRRVVVDTTSHRLVLQDGIGGDWYQQEFRRIPSGFVAFELDPGASRAVWYDSAGNRLGDRLLFSTSARAPRERAFVFEDTSRSRFMVIDGDQALALGYGGEELRRQKLPAHVLLAEALPDGTVLACGRAGGQILLAWLGPELEVRREVRVGYPYRFATPAGLVVERGDIWVGALCSDELPVSRRPMGVQLHDSGKLAGLISEKDPETGEWREIPIPAFVWFRLSEKGELLSYDEARGLDRLYRWQIPPPLGWLTSFVWAVRSYSRIISAPDGYPGWEVLVLHVHTITAGCYSLAYADPSGRVVMGRRFSSPALGPGPKRVFGAHYYHTQGFRLFSLVYHMALPRAAGDGGDFEGDPRLQRLLRAMAGTGMSGTNASTCNPSCVSEAACR